MALLLFSSKTGFRKIPFNRKIESVLEEDSSSYIEPEESLENAVEKLRKAINSSK